MKILVLYRFNNGINKGVSLRFSSIEPKFSKSIFLTNLFANVSNFLKSTKRTLSKEFLTLNSTLTSTLT